MESELMEKYNPSKRFHYYKIKITYQFGEQIIQTIYPFAHRLNGQYALFYFIDYILFNRLLYAPSEGFTVYDRDNEILEVKIVDSNSDIIKSQLTRTELLEHIVGAEIVEVK